MQRVEFKIRKWPIFIENVQDYNHNYYSSRRERLHYLFKGEREENRFPHVPLT